MSSACDVVCAGIVVADHVAAPIDILPDAGRLVMTDHCFLSIGGCASNVAVDLRKMDVSTAVCGCVGDDSFGRFARSVLDEHDVDTTFLTTVSEAATSQTLVINVTGQDRRFIHHLGASAVFAGKHFPRERIREARILYVGGYFVMDALAPAALADVFRDARRAGVVTMLDVVTPGPKTYREALAVILPHVDYFLPNSDEAQLMTGLTDPIAQAEEFRRLGAENVIITCGHEGAVLVSENRNLRSGVFDVDSVDATGGGDAFDAGFMCGLLEGATPERCLELGTALGASCVRKLGATDGVFTRRQTAEFLADRSLVVEPI